MSVLELVAPRISLVPEAADWSLGDEAVEWALAHGIKLDEEQQMMLRSMLGLDDEGRWAAFECAMNAPRQNGKNEVLIALELFLLFVVGVMSIVHSAHEFKTSSKHRDRMEAVIRANGDLLARVKRSPVDPGRIVGFRYSHGDESIELDSGEKIEFRTRTKTGMKGFDDVGAVVLDEAQVLSEWAHGSMVPTMRASKAEHGPLLVYSGNAPDKDRDDHAIVWTRVRERAIAADPEDSLAYHEYSLDFDSPDDVPDEVLEDPEQWERVNWAMAHGRITAKHMQNELRSLGRRQFIVELLGVGDYPDVDMAGNTEIDVEIWADLEDESSVLQDPVVLIYDVSPSRRTSIGAVGVNGNGEKHVELIHARAGTGWVPGRLREITEKHDVVAIACDGFGPANTLADAVEQETGMKVRRLNTGEYADACGFFANEVNERNVRHIGQDELTTAVRGARTRPLVDRWAWSRSKSKSDPGPLIVASIGLYVAADMDFSPMEIF